MIKVKVAWYLLSSVYQQSENEIRKEIYRQVRWKEDSDFRENEIAKAMKN